MENHFITFLILMLVGIGHLIYYTFLIVWILLTAIYKWIGKEIEERKEVNNNVINR